MTEQLNAVKKRVNKLMKRFELKIPSEDKDLLFLSLCQFYLEAQRDNLRDYIPKRGPGRPRKDAVKNGR